MQGSSPSTLCLTTTFTLQFTIFKQIPCLIQAASGFTSKCFKTDPFRHGCLIYIGTGKPDLCPVRTITQYLHLRGSNPASLFLLSDGTPLSCQWLSSAIQSILLFRPAPGVSLETPSDWPMAGLRGFASNGGGFLSMGLLATVEAPGYSRHPPPVLARQLVKYS